MTIDAPTTSQDRAARRADRERARTAARGNRKPTPAVIVMLALVAINVALLFVLPSRELVGAATIVLMLLLMSFRIPIGFALIIPAALGLFALQGFRALQNVMASTPYDSVASWSLSVLPMFILMAQLLASSGITIRVYDAARLWLGWLPGGLAVGTNVAGGGLAAVSGSTIGTAYSLGRIGIPEMLKSGYDRRLAVGSVIVASLPGQVIPPSISLIIIAGITGAAVGPQLLAGIVPGIGMVILMVLTIVLIVLIWPAMAGRSKEQRAAAAAAGQEVTAGWGARFKSLGPVWPLVALFVVVFGMMYGGLVTATEAGAVGALAAVLLTLWFRRNDRPLRYIIEGARRAVSVVGQIFLVLVGAMMITQLIAVTGLGRLFSAFIIDLGLDRVTFLLVVMLIYFLLGTFMEPLPMWLLTIPILAPVFQPLGIDIIWFGIFAVLMGEIAILSPPVGILTFIIHGLSQDKTINLGQKISLNDVYNATWMFMPTMFILVILIIVFPDIVMFIPDSATP